MAAYYFDTSAIVKRYLLETGSTWVRTITDTTNQRGKPIHSITIVSIGIVETVAAFARRHRMGQLDAAARQAMISLLVVHSKQQYRVVPLRDREVDLAIDLVQRHPLRGYDAVHLATALVLRDQLVAARLPAPIFVAADANLCAVARAEGLPAENPNDYP